MIKLKDRYNIKEKATLHCQRSCGKLVSCVTGVVPTVFRLQVLYTELSNAPFLPHPILLTRLEDHASLSPLNKDTWLRQLTAQSDIIPLYRILVLELFLEECRSTWWEFKMASDTDRFEVWAEIIWQTSQKDFRWKFYCCTVMPEWDLKEYFSWPFQPYLGPQSWIRFFCFRGIFFLPSTVRVTSHCVSPVSQVYVPESSGSRLWIRSWWNAPFFFRSYLRLALMAVLFLIQVTVAFGSEMVQARVTVSPSIATVLCGFSSISTENMGHP